MPSGASSTVSARLLTFASTAPARAKLEAAFDQISAECVAYEAEAEAVLKRRSLDAGPGDGPRRPPPHTDSVKLMAWVDRRTPAMRASLIHEFGLVIVAFDMYADGHTRARRATTDPRKLARQAPGGMARHLQTTSPTEQAAACAASTSRRWAMAKVVELPTKRLARPTRRRIVNMDGQAARPRDDDDFDAMRPAARRLGRRARRAGYTSSNEEGEGYLSVDKLKQATFHTSPQGSASMKNSGSRGTTTTAPSGPPARSKFSGAGRQPIITFNEVGPKIDNLVWIAQRFRTDPKAYPRTPAHSAGAEIATQCIRAVLDACEWPFLDGYCAGLGGDGRHRRSRAKAS